MRAIAIDSLAPECALTIEEPDTELVDLPQKISLEEQPPQVQLETSQHVTWDVPLPTIDLHANTDNQQRVRMPSTVIVLPKVDDWYIVCYDGFHYIGQVTNEEATSMEVEV